MKTNFKWPRCGGTSIASPRSHATEGQPHPPLKVVYSRIPAVKTNACNLSEVVKSGRGMVCLLVAVLLTAPPEQLWT